jgi:hypothetical protein
MSLQYSYNVVAMSRFAWRNAQVLWSLRELDFWMLREGEEISHPDAKGLG